MLPTSFVLSLLAGAAVAQLTASNLKTYVDSLSLTSSFNPIKESYWTGLPHHCRTPFAVSPDGKSAYLAYLDASATNVHVQQVDPSTFAAVGTAVTVTGGKEAGGLVAHNDGFALLTNEALPSGTSGAPPANTPVAVLYRYTSGKQTFKTFLGGPSNVGDMGALASPDLNGDLVYSEVSGLYGAYFVVTAYSGEAEGHFGDAIQYVTKDGTLKQIAGASSSWGCSHNTGIAFEAADAAPFASLCSEDQGAIWLNTGATGMSKDGVKVSNENVQNGAGNEAMGGMSGSYSSLARFIGKGSYIFTWVSRGAKDLTTNSWMGAGYTNSVNRTVNRNVAIASFSDKATLVGPQATSELGGDGDSQVNWITTGTADCQNAHVAAFDGTSAVVSWEEIANPTCEFIAMGCKGAFTGAYYQLVKDGKKVGTPFKSTNVYVAGDQVTMADGRVCWPYVDMAWKLDGPVSNPASVEAISFACLSLNGATGSTTAASSAAAVASTPAASKAPVSSAAPVKDTAESSAIKVSVTPSPAAPTPQVPAGSALPTFALVSSGATIDPPTTSTAYPEASSAVPASESFNPSTALAFTDKSDNPIASIGPVYSSILSSIAAIVTAVPEVPSAVIPTAVPVETPVASAVVPSVIPSSVRPSGYPVKPTRSARPSKHHGHRHPTNFRYSRKHLRPTGSRSRVPRPSAGFPSVYPVQGQAKPSETPCTLQTQVKPTPTPESLVR